jgi:hypothetical protein
MRMKKLRVLVLEDDIRSLRFILAALDELGDEKKADIAVTILSDHIQVREYVNKNPEISYDILLLDRDCFLGGSFHTVDLSRFDKEHAISISSIFENNQQAIKMGVKRVVRKDYDNLADFKDRIKQELARMM